VLDIELEEGDDVINMLRNNPNIDLDTGTDGQLSLQYRAKYELHDKASLLLLVERVKSGVVVADLRLSYPGVELDCVDLAVSGEVIEYKNNEKKTAVLYPRGRPFLSRIDGPVTAVPGEQTITTACSLKSDLRRGDAVRVNGSWYRISSATGRREDSEWARAVSSVTSDDERVTTRTYIDEFSDRKLPLDADFSGKTEFVGPVWRYGVSNDVRQLWKESQRSVLKAGDEELLVRELLSNNLISRASAQISSSSGMLVGQKRLQATSSEKRERKRSTNRRQQVGGHNFHVLGTDLERKAKEMLEASNNEN